MTLTTFWLRVCLLFTLEIKNKKAKRWRGRSTGANKWMD